MGKEVNLDVIIKNSKVRAPLAFQNIDAIKLSKAKKQFIKVKLIEVESYRTTRYPSVLFYKPISRVL